MFKLLRDSIFKPKNLISYRAKKWWFVLIYILIMTLLGSLANVVGPISYNGLTEAERLCITENTKYYSDNSYFKNGIYYGDELTIDVSDYRITFINKDASLSSVTESDIIVKGNEVYLMLSYTNNPYILECGKVDKYTSELNNNMMVNELDIDSPLFKGINEVHNKYKPLIITLNILVGMISSLILMMGFTLINYLYLAIAFRAKQFMKKGQLFKMLLFASTAVVLMDTMINALALPTIVYYFGMFIAFIPEIILEREIIRRIRIKLYGDKIINNEDVINKINELLNKKKDDNDDDNDKEDED